VKREPRVFINPEILEASEELAVYNEGCLSVPEIYAEVERPARIRARWQDLDGNIHKAEIGGMLATCLQHEMDHLEGIVFLDRISRLKRQMALKKLAKQRQAA
jgi:peptide deformylase